MPMYFNDSVSLQRYVRENNVYTRHGDISIGSLEFIDSDYTNTHVVFFSRKDYEDWKSDISKVYQICLF